MFGLFRDCYWTRRRNLFAPLKTFNAAEEQRLWRLGPPQLSGKCRSQGASVCVRWAKRRRRSGGGVPLAAPVDCSCCWHTALEHVLSNGVWRLLAWPPVAQARPQRRGKIFAKLDSKTPHNKWTPMPAAESLSLNARARQQAANNHDTDWRQLRLNAQDTFKYI